MATATLEQRQAVAYSLSQSFISTDGILRARIAEIALEPSHAKRKRMLRDLRTQYRAQADQLKAATDDWTDSNLKSIYAISYVGLLTSVGVPVPNSIPERPEFNAVQTEVADKLHGAIDHAQSDIDRMARATSAERLDTLLIGSGTPEEVSAALVKELSRLSVSGVVYSNGARHSLSDYATMVVRTATSMATNMGTIAGALDAGVKYLQIYDGPGCGLDAHNEPPMANGMVLTTEEAFAHPLAHPNCTREFGPLDKSLLPSQADDLPPLPPLGRVADRHQARVDARNARLES